MKTFISSLEHRINQKINIDSILVKRLLADQFPQFKDLPVRQVYPGGWDNRTFHLGNDMLVRMPSAEKYAAQVEKEQKWLPILAPLLPFSIPKPLAMGNPSEYYPWKWSIYRWLEGKTAASTQKLDLCHFATDLSKFLIALQSVNSKDGPLPGTHNFHRGGDIKVYDSQTRKALSILSNKIDVKPATKIWEEALHTTWKSPPVWVHGDLSANNLLVKSGKLSSIIDFGMLGVGDPACDLAITWTFFEGESREVFKSMLPYDDSTWARGRAWTLWKALIVGSGLASANAGDVEHSWQVIDHILAEYNVKNFNKQIVKTRLEERNELEETKLEKQKSNTNNCGSESKENFINYLTDSKLKKDTVPTPLEDKVLSGETNSSMHTEDID